MRTAVKWGHLQHNPARDVELPALKTIRPKWIFTPAQVNVYTQVVQESVKVAVNRIGEELFSIVQSDTEASGLIH
jgi:hypothetical protein